MSDAFNPGDTVCLKSGGPLMTVKVIQADKALCIWFDGPNKKEAQFPTVTIVHDDGSVDVLEAEG